MELKDENGASYPLSTLDHLLLRLFVIATMQLDYI